MLAVLSVVPIAWIVAVIVLRVRQMDEYQRKLPFPGLAVGFTVAMVTTLAVGTLGTSAPSASLHRAAAMDPGRAIGLEGLTPHELRHTAASHAVGAGANVKAVQRMLGHASAAMTFDTYADLFDHDLTAVADALDHRAMPPNVAILLPLGL